MRTAGGEISGSAAESSGRNLTFLYFPHSLQLQMKQKYKVSCHSREMESTDEDVHFESKKKSWEKSWWNSSRRERRNTQLTGWILDNLDDKHISSDLLMSAVCSAGPTGQKGTSKKTGLINKQINCGSNLYPRFLLCFSPSLCSLKTLFIICRFIISEDQAV